MKAESYVFTGIQAPMTYFGLSSRLLLLLVIGVFFIFVIFVAIDFLIFAILAPVVFLIFGWVKLYRKTRNDTFFAHKLFAIPKFWKGRTERTLMAGSPQTMRKS